MPDPDYLRLSSSSEAAANDWWRWPNQLRAFGGQMLGHCVMAAGKLAPANFNLHSLHMHFLRAGQLVDTRYAVHVVRIGRSYAVYKVIATEIDQQQEQSLLCSCTVSFCKPEDGPSLLPDTLPLHLFPPPADFFDDVGSDAWPRTAPADASGRRWYVSWQPQHDGNGKRLTSSSPPLVHAAALAFLSDYYFLISAFAGDAELSGEYDCVMLASLDHTLHVLEPQFDASGLLLYESTALGLTAGRAVICGKLWAVTDATGRSGRLVATTVQEGVLRLREKAQSDEEGEGAPRPAPGAQPATASARAVARGRLSKL